MTEPATWFGVLNMSPTAKTYLFVLVLTAVMALVAKNLQRTRTGRAFMAIRDRDVAAEVMGVDEFRTKTLAFAISSFYAGIAGALLATFIGRTIPEQWNPTCRWSSSPSSSSAASARSRAPSWGRRS